jgi:hypothetical protein
MLTPADRALLFRACWDHPVADAQGAYGEARITRETSADLRKEAQRLRDAAGVTRAESETARHERERRFGAAPVATGPGFSSGPIPDRRVELIEQASGTGRLYHGDAVLRTVLEAGVATLRSVITDNRAVEVGDDVSRIRTTPEPS